ncbi:MAG: NAD-glutamate dehydrogenase [Motiliproteus sp.]|nr:NAD-glutamate dehydrogenase [Motiliproteus sp.]
MFDLRINSKDKILEQLTELFNARFEGPKLSSVVQFCQRYYSVSPLEELRERKLENLYGATLSAWQFIQKHNEADLQLRVYNPDFEQHGWHCNHTVIEILQKDAPFLVDSVRMALSSRGIAIHASHNTVLYSVRDDQGQLQQLDGKGSAESIIYLEVDRHSDDEELKTIRSQILDVLTDVHLAVNDFSTMADRARSLIAELETNKGPDYQAAAEARRFLNWMLDDHFTFLGYDELSLKGGGKSLKVSRVKGQELGTLKRYSQTGRSKDYQQLRQAEIDFIQTPEPLMFAKDSYRSLVHRPAYRDLVVIKRYGKNGNVVGECRFYGLFTSTVFSQQPTAIPYVAGKIKEILKRAGLDPQGHSGKELQQVLTDLPREELFLSSTEELFETAMGVFNLQGRRKARLFIRRDPCGKFYSCLYYAPRDIYSTALRQQVENILCEQLVAMDSEFHTHFSESILARTHFVVQVDPANPVDYDPQLIENLVVDASRSWDDDLHHALVENCGEELGNRYAHLYRGAFPSAYREHFVPGNGVYDIQRLQEISDGAEMAMSFYRVLEQSKELLRFKLFTAGDSLVLSDVIPILENLGMRVVGEHPYQVRRRDGEFFWMHDFTLIYNQQETVDLQQVKQLFQDAFSAIWQQKAENDAFNRMVIGANLSWREVAMIRAYASYIHQIRFGFSQPYVADTLSRHQQISKLLVALFKARFDPQRQTSDKVQALIERIENSILDGLDKVESLNDDKILRRFLELIKATVRTNYFQCDSDGTEKSYFSFKISPEAISDMPLPRPKYEVFVYSPRVEGVHLRAGKVARGGLRWSDRLEDYRTEVLGLVKAQQVKNAVIVPVGAKGGFVAKKLPEEGGREEIQAEGIASYQIFIRGLLDLADNLVSGEVQSPLQTVRHDEDDPYLVVAADKGTATFSDIANNIAEEYDFWLGDAFASGGSQGYDHKGMGITARGAWESVKRHFRERGLDTQQEPFSVIAIGDMSGDVFGNGMLLSDQILLQAAFNHQHIFIDPAPDQTAGFAERQRLFELPRSSWSDYDQKLISKGGGVFSRQAKSIDISPEMQRCFGIIASKMPPQELISALLRAPVDLIWNGGIGTYVKSSTESHADVGDKTNDGLRIDGRDLRCKVLGEGGNLGFTQLGRVEFCLNGGAAYTDFIDNAGGVDCSDHEVNIKILLNEVMAQGDITQKQRNRLLKEMTDEVAELVLHHNYNQVQAISIAERQNPRLMDEYIRLIERLESEGKLDRELEFLPDDEQIQQRRSNGQSFSRPELSVLISYAKTELKQALTDPMVADDPFLAREIHNAFPSVLVNRYPQQIEQHRLRGEIIATQIANSLVNRMGISYAQSLSQSCAASYVEVASAYVIAREVFAIDRWWTEIEALDNQVDADVQMTMMTELMRLVRRASYWLLKNHRNQLQVAEVIERYRPGVSEMLETLPKTAVNDTADNKRKQWLEAGVPESLATVVSAVDNLFALLGIVQVAEQTEAPLQQVSEIYFQLGDQLELSWFDQQVREFEPDSHWQAVARDSYRDDLNSQQRALTASVLRFAGQAESVESSVVEQWSEQNCTLISRWQSLLVDIRGSQNCDIAIFSVAVRELLELAQVSNRQQANEVA